MRKVTVRPKSYVRASTQLDEVSQDFVNNINDILRLSGYKVVGTMPARQSHISELQLSARYVGPEDPSMMPTISDIHPIYEDGVCFSVSVTLSFPNLSWGEGDDYGNVDRIQRWLDTWASIGQYFTNLSNWIYDSTTYGM